MNLVHPFFKNYPDSIKLFSGINKMGSWTSRVSKIAKQIEIDPTSVIFISKETDPIKIANNFRGESFEGFGEIFLKVFGVIPQIGIRNYEPCSSDEDVPDMGVDGKGIGNNGKMFTVQFKFRGDPEKVLNAEKDHLNNFVNASWEKPFCVDINDTENMLIITTGKEILYKDMLVEWRDKVKYIAYNQSWGCFKSRKFEPNKKPTNIFSLKSLVDNNTIFWEIAKEEITNNNR